MDSKFYIFYIVIQTLTIWRNGTVPNVPNEKEKRSVIVVLSDYYYIIIIVIIATVVIVINDDGVCETIECPRDSIECPSF